MKYEVHLVTPGSSLYEQGLAFAYAAYVAIHNARIVVRPDVLAVALRQGSVLGTMGLIFEHGALHFFEQCDPPEAFERLAPRASRETLAEISRFTVTQSLSPRDARSLSETLSAHLFAYGHMRGIRHFGFVGKENFRTFLNPLGITLIPLGVPTFNKVPHELVGAYTAQKNLFCFGFTLTNLEQLRQTSLALQAD